MGKIYNALRRSGVYFDQESVSKRALNENEQVATSEKRALKQAISSLEQKYASKTELVQSSQITVLEKIDSWLMDLGLGKDQISQQNIKELNKSLHRIDGLIAYPESFLKQKFKDTVNSETNFKLFILPILLERRMFILKCGDELVNKSKISNLRRLVKRISDISIKSSIEKILDDLQIKNTILKKEYQKLENLRLNIHFEQQRFSPEFEKLTDSREKTSKSFRDREPMTTFVMGILLILITLLIAISPFVEIQVPDILNSVLFIILGFFFGQTIGKLVSFRETQKFE